MENGQTDFVLGGKFQQHMEETHGIRTSRDRNTEAAASREHAITRDDSGNAIDHSDTFIVSPETGTTYAL
jgi:hypothetical protein